MTGRTEIRVREIHRRTRRYRRRYENRALYSLTAFSLFLFSGIGILLRKVQSGGVPTVADSYGSVLLRGGASAYVVVGIAAFAVGVTVTVICIRLKNKSTDRTVSTKEREDEMKLKKRILSLLLCGAMLFSLCPQSVLAEENGQAGGVTAGTSGLCEHHPEHNADCGYTEGTAGTPCGHEHTVDCYEEVTNCVHEHDGDCYPEESVSGNEAAPSGEQKREPTECTHVCSEESGCITKELNCQHEHDSECGYSPAAEGTPCGYVCELCGGKDHDKAGIQPEKACICTSLCTTEAIEEDCPVCGAENADLMLCEGEAKTAPPSNAEAVTVASVQAMIDALPGADEITDDNAEEVEEQLEAIDEAKAQLSDEETDELDMTRYAEAAAALGALAAPMLLANDSPDEQFSLKPGGTYYFDLSGASIPGTANSGNSVGAASLPDTSLHYVPFTYAGTIEAYKLTSEMATTEAYAQQYKYAHSLFIADYAVTHTVSWDDLNTKSLIFGKDYVAGGVDYTLRAPSVGSNYTGSGNSERGVPQSNECDTMLNKDSGYIQNWNKMYSWGQDAFSGDASSRALCGYFSARHWSRSTATNSYPSLGFRPVLEVLNPDTLGSDGMKVVTLDLGGGTLGNSSEDIQIIVKTGSEFTAPASGGLTRPDGNTGSYFMWLGSNGKLYAPGDSVPADVTKLTAQFALSEQFSLKPGDTYYFDLSGEDIPGTANSGNSDGAVSLPDTSLHYVPFTYVGTIEAYKLTSATVTTEEYAQQNKYPHSLFVADYAVTHTISWGGLNDEGLIFGKNYASGGVDYTLRAPSVGSISTGSGDSQRGVPQSNEWDTMLNKNSGYIQNWNKMYSWGQDTVSAAESFRAYRGYNSARSWYYTSSSFRNVYLGFRPVLEVLNPDTLGSDGMKAVTLDLNGGKLGGSSDAIQIIVKNGSAFTAPMSGGLTRPDGNTGSYFMWLDGNGNSYEPGGSVPADVTTLTVQWTAPTYTVTLNTNGGTINSGNVTSYTYGAGATLPTADDMTYTGHRFKGWYDNESLTGTPVTAIGSTETGNKEYWAKWEATPNYLDLSGYPEFGNDETVTVNGRTYPIGTDGGRYVNLPETGDILQRFTYLSGGYSAAHENYPTGMAAYRIIRQEGGAKLEPIEGLDNLLIYSGCSIRLTGKQGIRMITGITQENKKALTGKAGLAGYTLEEYGTLICWNTDLTSGDDFSLDMSCARHNYAYLKGKADPVFARQEGKMLYTNVLVGFGLEDCAKDLILRPYIKLKDMTTGETVTLYGGSVCRSIGYIAKQNENTYKPGTAGYKYVHEIIDAVYGKTEQGGETK